MNRLYCKKYVHDDTDKWIVMIHGFGGSSRMWMRQIVTLRKKYNLFVFDLPGHGKSEEGIIEEGVKNFGDLADVIVHTLNDNGIQKATFMCVSIGTLVFAGLLDKYPDIVDGAILCGGVSGVNKGLEWLLHAANCIKRILPTTVIMVVCSFVLLPRKDHKKSRNFFIKSSRDMGREEFIAWINMCMAEFNILKKLKDYSKKILFIEGSEDYVLLKGVQKKMEELKTAQIYVMEKCGHVCNVQKAQEFNQVAMEYIDNVIEG